MHKRSDTAVLRDVGHVQWWLHVDTGHEQLHAEHCLLAQEACRLFSAWLWITGWHVSSMYVGEGDERNDCTSGGHHRRQGMWADASTQGCGFCSNARNAGDS